MSSTAEYIERKSAGRTMETIPMEVHFSYLSGLLEALNDLSVNMPVVERPSRYDAADAVLAAIELHIEAMERKFIKAFYGPDRGFDAGIWPPLPKSNS